MGDLLTWHIANHLSMELFLGSNAAQYLFSWQMLEHLLIGIGLNFVQLALQFDELHHGLFGFLAFHLLAFALDSEYFALHLALILLHLVIDGEEALGLFAIQACFLDDKRMLLLFKLF